LALLMRIILSITYHQSIAINVGPRKIGKKPIPLVAARPTLP
jgi:hypothetical protein